MTKQAKYINAMQKDKSAKAKFAYEIAKREAKGLNELEATYQQAIRLIALLTTMLKSANT